jgi:SNF2 family DNA or RNA helicase
MFPYTKILEVPIVLHKKINDEDILLFTKSYGTTYVYVIDRNDLQKDPNYNMNYQYIDISKIQSTIIKEPFYFGHEMVCYKYLDTTNEVGDHKDFYLYKNETINAIKLSNETFITKSYLKHRIVCKLEKRNETYSLCYYYNDKCLGQFFDARRKDYILIYLLERAEKQRIINNSLEGLNKILTCKLPNNSKASYKSKDLDSSVIFKDVQLYNYQKDDVLWFKSIEGNILNDDNKICYNVNYYYPILNDDYLISSYSKNIIPNINKLMYNSYNSDNMGSHLSIDHETSTIVDTRILELLKHFMSTKTIKYYGGNIISDLGLGKTLIVLYAILSEFFDKDSNPINRNLYNFIDFKTTCNYFYKQGNKKGKCCDKDIIESSTLFCNEHKNSIFIDKKKIVLKNMEYFNIKNYINVKNNLIDTKSTLIICPSHLCNQWVNEYYSKCNDKVKSKTHVLLITTYNQYANLTVSDILFSDIIIISYSFLINSKYMNVSKRFKTSIHHADFLNSTEFPLDMFNWHRVIFEEFHEIRNMNSYNNIKRVCKSLESTFKWNISGTPFANGINGYLDSLELNTDIVLPYLESNRHAQTNFECNELTDIHGIGLNTSHELIKNTSFLFKRNTKETVKNEYTSNLIVDKLKLLNFTDEERSIYDSHLIGFNNKYSKFLIQLCCHPELYNETKQLLKNCKTLSEIRDALLNHNKKNLDIYKHKINLLQEQITKLECSDYETSSETSTQLSILRRNLTNDMKMYNNFDKTHTYLQNTIETIENVDSCPICLEDIDNVAITSCGHKFCWECIENFTKSTHVNKCPCCKNEFSLKDIYLLKKQDHQDDKQKNFELNSLINDTKSTKIGNIIFWIKQQINSNSSSSSSSSNSNSNSNSSSSSSSQELDKPKKIIIFSQWDEILNKVSEYLENYQIPIVHCKGSVYQKKKSIDTFVNSDKYNIIMLSSRNAASGINLTVANQIVLIEPVYGTTEYRKSIEDQAIWRCARIGNTQTINVTRFIVNDTIESDIYNNTFDDTKLKILSGN